MSTNNLTDKSAVIFRAVLPVSRNGNLIHESVASSTQMMEVFAVIVADNPCITPTVPGLDGLGKLAVTHACVAPATVEMVLPGIIILEPAVHVSCFAFTKLVMGLDTI